MSTVSNVRKEKKFNKSKHNKGHLEPAIKLVDRISKVDTLPLGEKLSQFRPLLQTEVVSNKVSVDAILPPLLGVVQDV